MNKFSDFINEKKQKSLNLFDDIAENIPDFVNDLGEEVIDELIEEEKSVEPVIVETQVPIQLKDYSLANKYLEEIPTKIIKDNVNKNSLVEDLKNDAEFVSKLRVLPMSIGGGCGRNEVDLAIYNQSQESIFEPDYNYSATTIKEALYEIDNRLTNTVLNSLADVDVSSASDYSMLMYNETSGIWENSDVLWDDLTFPASQTKQGANLYPVFDEVNVGLLFPQNNTAHKIYINAQFPHKRKSGTNIRPHIHYVQSSVNQPTFIMQYRWYNNGDIIPEFVTVSTSANKGIFIYTSGSLAQIANFPEIDGTDKGLSSIMDIVIWRQDNDVTGNVLVKDVDIHYRSDSYGGSRTEYNK